MDETFLRVQKDLWKAGDYVLFPKLPSFSSDVFVVGKSRGHAYFPDDLLEYLASYADEYIERRFKDILVGIFERYDPKFVESGKLCITDRDGNRCYLDFEKYFAERKRSGVLRGYGVLRSEYGEKIFNEGQIFRVGKEGELVVIGVPQKWSKKMDEIFEKWKIGREVCANFLAEVAYKRKGKFRAWQYFIYPMKGGKRFEVYW